MLKVKLTRTQSDAYGLYDYRVIPFGGDQYVTITGEILIDDEIIGNMTMYELSGDVNLYDMAYQVPGDTLTIAEQICDMDGFIRKSFAIEDKFVILDNIRIEPEYRNNGYGSIIMQNILVYLNDAYNHSIDSVVLYTGVLDDMEGMDINALNNHCDRLVKFYEKAGFSNAGFNVMIKKKG